MSVYLSNLGVQPGYPMSTIDSESLKSVFESLINFKPEVICNKFGIDYNTIPQDGWEFLTDCSDSIRHGSTQILKRLEKSLNRSYSKTQDVKLSKIINSQRRLLVNEITELDLDTLIESFDTLTVNIHWFLGSMKEFRGRRTYIICTSSQSQ